MVRIDVGGHGMVRNFVMSGVELCEVVRYHTGWRGMMRCCGCGDVRDGVECC